MSDIASQLNQAMKLEEMKRWQQAKTLYRQILAHDPHHEAVHRELLRVLDQEIKEYGRSPKRLEELFQALHDALDVGVQGADIVVSLAHMHWARHQKEIGMQVVEKYFRQEGDLAQLRQALFAATYMLHSEIPADYTNMLRLHDVFLEQTVIPLSAYDRLSSYLKDAPGDRQDAYFSTGRADEWFTAVEGLWDQLSRTERQDLRSSYLRTTFRGYQRAKRYDQALERGRQYLRWVKSHLPEPSLSCGLAEIYATLMAPVYQQLGKRGQITRAFNLAEHYLTRYEEVLRSDSSLTDGWTDDQFVQPYANIGAGALRCGNEVQALRLYRAAERVKPGVGVVNMFLSGLTLTVEQNRQLSLYHLGRALTAAEVAGGNAVERVQEWFRTMNQFQAVQEDAEFLVLIQSALGRK